MSVVVIVLVYKSDIVSCWRAGGQAGRVGQVSGGQSALMNANNRRETFCHGIVSARVPTFRRDETHIKIWSFLMLISLFLYTDDRVNVNDSVFIRVVPKERDAAAIKRVMWFNDCRLNCSHDFVMNSDVKCVMWYRGSTFWIQCFRL